jgi:hypothetical protein
MRSNMLVHSLVIATLVFFHIVAVPSLHADCEPWPNPPSYYTAIWSPDPSNWVECAFYAEGDVVFKRIGGGRFYVVPGAQHDLQAPFPACCPDGPYFVTASGGLFFVWAQPVPDV